MLKKQTVWLLTMLSLMIVLSVYYIMADPDESAFDPSGDDITESETAAPGTDGDDTEATDSEDVDVENTSAADSNELFTMLRMEIQDERSMKKDRLKDIVTSSSASIDEKNQAFETMDHLDETSKKEAVLEKLIGAEAENYKDVFVRSDDDKVDVHVMGTELSREEVINIMKMVEDEFGEVTVNVNQGTSEG
ncbi:Stage III sporulation protein AH [Lentibacillus sp. JNUCC-1]|uniref:SpoIIIAH-like family protein n=1 Tax=Lentibacillus sp. JNUCC-1 TaxID=2654513 RepID=UPI0012E8A7D4|nr:SpoIIIAH-like family protein [Lentibacillus sp. JNUCC-1]MUV39675.1 Stage III sporulation protein AH [Lentibacillus sp. JNUCC-1]